MPDLMRLTEFLNSNIWAIREDKLLEVYNVIARRAYGVHLSKEEIQAIVESARPGRPAKAKGNIAILPVMGVISHRASMVQDMSSPGGASAESLSKQFSGFMADPTVSTIILDVCSPGGTVSGVPELSEQIFNARGQKQIIAVANAEAASAAYWIASSASEFVVTPSGEVGSIGVFMMHQDMSKMYSDAGMKTTFIKAGKFKAEGNPYEPLSEEAHSAFQASVNGYYEQFAKAVARNRGVNVSDVRNSFGQGRMVMADEAARMGMVDRVATMDQVLERLGVASSSDRKAMAGEIAEENIQASETPAEEVLDKLAEDVQEEKMSEVDMEKFRRDLDQATFWK